MKLNLGYDYAPTNRNNADGRRLDVILKEIKIDEGRTIPLGFLTDWGSIPDLVDRVGIDIRRGSWAYLKHDFNYRTRASGRFRSDVELYRDQRFEGVCFIERCLVFLGVRLGGVGAYNKDHTPNDIYVPLSKWGGLLMTGDEND